jgi:hypothetical protein
VIPKMRLASAARGGDTYTRVTIPADWSTT